MATRKLLFLLLFFLVTGQSGYAQTSSPVNYFSEFDFSNGDWELYGIQDWEHFPMKEEQFKIYESVGNFYTDNLLVLQQIKEYLSPLNKEPRGYAAPYYLELYKNDTLQAGIGVNMDNDFVSNYKLGKRYAVAPDLIKNLIGKVKKIPMTKYVFPTLEEARKGYELLLKTDTVLIKYFDPPDLNWLTYEGCTEILYLDTTYASASAIVRQNIKKDCPSEKFLLETGGSSSAGKMVEMRYWIFSNEKLGSSIKTNKVRTPWTKFNNIKLLVYGLTKEQIDQLMRE